MENEIKEFLNNIDYNQLFSILLPMTVVCYVHYMSTETKLNRNKSLDFKYVKEDIYSIFKKNNSQKNKKRFKEEYVNTINNFYETIQKKAPYVDLSICKHNLTTLKIGERNIKLYNFITRDNVDGLYNSLFNKINVDNKDESNSLNHELLHMATTIKKGTLSFTGFKQVILNLNPLYSSIIGTGLNEGYTEVLAERYFGEGNSYYAEKYYASLLENIVGKEKMEQLYFKADLNGLIEELEKYETRDNILNFVENLDYLNKNIEKSYKNNNIFDTCQQKADECSGFIVSCLFKRLDYQYTNGLISQSEYENIIKSVTSSTDDLFGTITSEKITLEKMINIFNKLPDNCRIDIKSDESKKCSR
ncbi:MAG: hypothetical protein ACI4OT_06035 [Bacilli bacterium]